MPNVYRFVLTVVFLGVPSGLFAQTPSPKLSPAERVDQVFARWDSTKSPGCAVSVIKDGHLVYKRGYGMANLDHDIPIRFDTVFHVASVSKEFTAASIALLALEGKLSLDDPIQKHLPWLPNFGHKITIRNLVHHNSGIRDQWSLLGMSGWRYSRDLITDDDVIYLLKKQRDLNFLPGERYLYSNSGYTLMSQIVKQVSGQTLREFTTQRIFKPLGMTRTHFRDDFSEIVKDQAFGYRWDRDDSVFRLSVTNFDTVGATSLLTTVEDLARWDHNFIDPVVGGQAFLDLIHRRGILTDGEEQDYAFGLVHGTYRGLRTVGHGGSDAGYRSHFVRFPDQGFSFASLCNLAQTNPGRLARDVADIYLEGKLKPLVAEEPVEMQHATLGAAQRERALGVYWSQSLATALQVESHEDRLHIRLGSRDGMEMNFRSDGVFHVSEMDVQIRFEPTTGPIERMVFWPSGERENSESLDRVAPFEISETSLREFAGSYASPELPVTYEISLEAGQLTLQWLKGDPDELRPLAKDLLVGDTGSLRFQRDSNGTISGFILDSGRVRNFRFSRLQ